MLRTERACYPGPRSTISEFSNHRTRHMIKKVSLCLATDIITLRTLTFLLYLGPGLRVKNVAN